MITNKLLLSKCRKISRSESMENAISYLRKRGYSKIDTIVILVEADILPLPTAKKIVHESETWKDVYKKHDDFQESLVGRVHDHIGGEQQGGK